MTWETIIKEEEQKEYFQQLMKTIKNEYANKIIYPKYEEIFNALNLTPLDQVKVVIIGQDPYHTPNYAMGLAFSVNDGIVLPKSLINIFQEIHNELGINFTDNGNLTMWAKKGILLLNRILTVEQGKPLSHKNLGWENFTMRLIQELNRCEQKIVFLLFGKEASKLQTELNNPHHLVLTTSHPSPLGAYRGFMNSGVFKKTCEFLDCDGSLWEL